MADLDGYPGNHLGGAWYREYYHPPGYCLGYGWARDRLCILG
ncbi:hypothetical protein ALC56_10906 [Trachymyrmex septentrionalis]|uniref:Uncharacterized protein n=1 Tax=Trachymyrmex septentrionalis TaxID=34720 RepID=A0A195F398_9HYME|nr:hypothetical protein ALC56_10906 [Trachymyrmex septentrionalis]